MNSPSIEIVVAHYQEDLGWLEDLNPLIQPSVYHKGASDILLKSPSRRIDLPNVGREAHTYLHHIMARYDTLSDLTGFTRGGSSMDIPGLNPILNIFLQNLSLFSRKKELYIDLCPHIELFSSKVRKENLQGNYETLGDFFQYIFEIPLEDREYACRSHSAFIVHKNNILRHSKKFYEKILDTLSHSTNPREAHFMEHLWKTILGSPTCYDVAQKPGELRKGTEVDGKTIKTPTLHPFEEEIKKSLFIAS